MIATSAINAGGADLRPNRNTDLAGLVAAESRRNAELAQKVAELRKDVDGLAKTDAGSISEQTMTDAAVIAGQTPVRGPAVVVTLDDAPAGVRPAGVSPELLVVHQQGGHADARQRLAGQRAGFVAHHAGGQHQSINGRAFLNGGSGRRHCATAGAHQPQRAGCALTHGGQHLMNIGQMPIGDAVRVV